MYRHFHVYTCDSHSDYHIYICIDIHTYAYVLNKPCSASTAKMLPQAMWPVRGTNSMGPRCPGARVEAPADWCDIRRIMGKWWKMHWLVFSAWSFLYIITGSMAFYVFLPMQGKPPDSKPMVQRAACRWTEVNAGTWDDKKDVPICQVVRGNTMKSPLWCRADAIDPAASSRSG